MFLPLKRRSRSLCSKYCKGLCIWVIMIFSMVTSNLKICWWQMVLLKLPTLGWQEKYAPCPPCTDCVSTRWWISGMNLPPSSSFQFFQVKWVLSTSIGLNAFVVLIFFICSKNSTKKSGGLFLMLSWKVLTWLRYNDELGCIRDKWCYNSLSLHTSGSELFSCKWWKIIHSVVPLRVRFTPLYIHM